MRKETLLVIGVLAVIFSTVAMIWFFALPSLRPIKFSIISDVTLTIAQTGQSRVLDIAETKALNHWLQTHSRGWAPLTSPAPSNGDVMLKGRTPNGDSFELSLWTGVSGADWNKTAITRANAKARLKIQTFSTRDWAVLRYLIEGQNFDRMNIP